MATLQIRKKSSKTWLHVPSDADEFILSKFYCKTDDDIFKIVEESGSSRKEYTFDNITVYDDTAGGTMETFASSQALMIRLEALQYVGFNEDGDVIIANLVSTDPSNNINLGTDGKLFSTGGGSTLGLIKIVDKAGDFFTNLATASAYIRTFTSATITDESYSNGTFWFTVPNGSSFGLTTYFLGHASVAKSAYIEDPLGLITTFGVDFVSGEHSFMFNTGNNILGNATFARSFVSSTGNNIFGNCTFGNTSFGYSTGNNTFGNCTFRTDNCFVSATGINKFKNILLQGSSDNFGVSSSGRFEIYGTIGTTTGNDYPNFFTNSTAVIWAPKSKQTINAGGIEGDLARAQTNGAKLFFGYVDATYNGANVGTVGSGIFKDITSNTFNFRNIVNAGGIGVAINNTDNTIELTNQNTNIIDMNDTFFGTLVPKDIIQWDGTNWVNVQPSGNLTRQEFTFVASQNFTLTYTPSGIYSVFVNGQELNSSQYSSATNVLTIVDTLESGDKVNIVYSAAPVGVVDYYTKAEIDGFNYEESHPNFIEVNALSDLPTQIGGVITLVAGYTYLILKHLDLLGNRIVCSQDTVIVGWSSENCSITSTGLSAATALITSVYSLPIRNISFTHDLVFDLQGDGTTTALDWFGVNLLNCASGGTIKNYTNFVVGDSALLNSGGFTFDGTIGTVAFSNCLFDLAPTKTAINVLSTCTISRRLRIIYSSFVVLSGETGVNFSTSATVSSERYILDTVNFSGGGTYTSGVTYTDNKALFANCVGINNTSTRGFMYMLNNATDTTIGGGNANVWLKASGTTTAGTNSKFTHTTNRLTYNGAFVGSFLVTLNATVRSGGTNQNISIGVAKNGTIIAESEGIIRTGTSNTEHGGSTQAVLEMTSTDYIELFVRNTSTTDVRVTDFNFNVIKIPV